jgi:hypothetical protein
MPIGVLVRGNMTNKIINIELSIKKYKPSNPRNTTDRDEYHLFFCLPEIDTNPIVIDVYHSFEMACSKRAKLASTCFRNFGNFLDWIQSEDYSELRDYFIGFTLK